jgi:hypothetical protein
LLDQLLSFLIFFFFFFFGCDVFQCQKTRCPLGHPSAWCHRTREQDSVCINGETSSFCLASYEVGRAGFSSIREDDGSAARMSDAQVGSI